MDTALARPTMATCAAAERCSRPVLTPIAMEASSVYAQTIPTNTVSGPARIEQGAHSWLVRASLTISDAPDTVVRGTFHGTLDGLVRGRPVTIQLNGGHRYAVTIERYVAASRAGAVASIPVNPSPFGAPGTARPGSLGAHTPPTIQD